MWQPSCSHDAMKARAECYAQIRAFFMARGVLEVETPVLSQAGATDPLLASISTRAREKQYLQTSPEFPMKRLLASGSGPIYQICKCFREAEVGGRHNPEFTMLEWYRPGLSLLQLIQEVSELVEALTGRSGYEILSYRQAFLSHLGIDPFDADLNDLQTLALEKAHFESQGDESHMDRDAYLDLLLSVCVEPQLGKTSSCFLIDYPASQASLAKTARDEHGQLVAKRAELYIDGIEIANAYDELTDANEQRMRFYHDNRTRNELGLAEVAVDEHLISALPSLPDCSGVALGLDRLLMIRMGVNNIRDVVCFAHDQA
jgi:elongation factor P--(R)-beta-lysine ligase